MTGLIKKIALVLVVIVIADRVFAALFMNIFFENTFSGESGGTINYAIHKKNNIDFLILGPSRAKHGIDPKLITSLGANGYNLGINATAMLNSMLVLDILVQRGVTTKVLVLQTDLSDYSSSTDKNLLDQIKRLYPYDTEKIREYVQLAGPQEQALYFFDLYKLNRKVLNIGFNFLKRKSIGDSSGYVGLPAVQFPPDGTNIVKNLAYDKSSLNRKALTEVERISREKGIDLIIVFPPSYNNVFYNKEEQNKLVEDLRKEGVKYIVDFSDINTIQELSKEQYWRDALHLNATGSQLFSSKLNKEIQKIYKTNKISR